jgi:hypothetical protein
MVEIAVKKSGSSMPMIVDVGKDERQVVHWCAFVRNWDACKHDLHSVGGAGKAVDFVVLHNREAESL